MLMATANQITREVWKQIYFYIVFLNIYIFLKLQRQVFIREDKKNIFCDHNFSGNETRNMKQLAVGTVAILNVVLQVFIFYKYRLYSNYAI